MTDRFPDPCDWRDREIERLRLIIKSQEWSEGGGCPWCWADKLSQHGRHFEACQTFTEEGEVR